VIGKRSKNEDAREGRVVRRPRSIRRDDPPLIAPARYILAEQRNFDQSVFRAKLPAISQKIYKEKHQDSDRNAQLPDNPAFGQEADRRG
jgi:hypothetical protein